MVASLEVDGLARLVVFAADDQQTSWFEYQGVAVGGTHCTLPPRYPVSHSWGGISSW